MSALPVRIGPYEVLAELGRGGMGVVYRARDTRLSREVALKVIADAAGFEDDGAARFRREAQAAATLAGHPNIVGVHDIGEHEGTLYLAMELIEGGTSLEDLVLEGELTPMQAAELMAKLARAVHHAHGEGILHRDLKPANVLVTPGVRPHELVPHVTDFGLARTQTADAELTRLTTSGELLGTPAYMAPEQARGEEVDARADVYALGATFYEMLAGRPPFRADSVTGTILQALRDPPKPLRQVVPTAPKALDAIVNKTLEKDAQHRYQTAAALAEDLERFVRGESVVARIPDPVTRAARWARRRPLTLAIGALVLGGGAFGAGVWWSSTTRDQADAKELTTTAEERNLAERAARLSNVYSGLVRDTAPALRTLEDHWHGFRTGPDPRPEALATIRTATDAARAAHPDLRLPDAWAALAQFFAGEEDAALAALATTREGSGDDPFPALLSALALFARYAHEAGLPAATITEAGLELAAPTESDAMKGWRTEGAELLAPLVGAPIWKALSHGTEAAGFAEAMGAFTRKEWKGAAAPLLPLLDDPLLGGTAADLGGLALYLDLDLEGAAATWERLGERGWPHALRDAGLAVSVRADVARYRNADPGALLERAGALLDRALAITPGDHLAHNARGITHRVSGDLLAAAGKSPLDAYEAALESYTQVLARVPRSSTTISNRGRVHRAIGDWVKRKRRDPLPHYQAALKDLDQALQFKPDNLTARRNRANCRKRVARTLGDRGRDPRRWYRGAIADYDVTLAVPEPQRDPRNYGSRATAWRALAEAEMARGGDAGPAFERAVADCTVWVKLAKGGVQPLYERARVHAAHAQWIAKGGQDPSEVYARAFADFAAVQKLEHEHAWGLFEEGRARRYFGIWTRDTKRDAEAARALFESAVRCQKLASEYQPRSAKFRISLSAARQTLGDAVQAAGGDGKPMYQRAHEDCSAVIDRDRRNATAWMNRGLINWKLAVALDQNPDYFQRAAADLLERMRLRPRDASSQYLLAKCYQKLDRVDDAIAAMEATLKLDPKHRFAPGRLKDLRKRKAELDAEKK